MDDFNNAVPVFMQIGGAVSLVVGFALWLGIAAAFITAGVCAIIGGAVAEWAIIDNTAPDQDEGEVSA